MVARRSRDGEGSFPWTGRTRPHKGGRAVLVDKVSPGPGNSAPTAVKSKCSTVGATCGRPRTGGPTERKFAGFGIMTWFPVWEIFGPVGLEKMVICDRSRCRGAHCASAPGRLRPGKRGLCRFGSAAPAVRTAGRETRPLQMCGGVPVVGAGSSGPTISHVGAKLSRPGCRDVWFVKCRFRVVQPQRNLRAVCRFLRAGRHALHSYVISLSTAPTAGANS